MKAPTPRSARSMMADTRSSSYRVLRGGKGAPARMELHHLEIHPADNGMIVKHMMHEPAAEYAMPKQHVFGHDEHKAMLKHVGETVKKYSAHEIDGQ